MPTPTLLFDVNETLLDMSALDALFEKTFGTAHARYGWFLTLQGLWMTSTLTGSFQPFDTLAAAAFRMTGEHYGLHLTKDNRDRIVDAMRTLPAHADAGPALDLLRESGIRIAALSNGGLKGVSQQLRRANLLNKFEAVFAADQVKEYKPAAAPYLFATRKLRVKPSGSHLVAAHAWDIAGAAAAGLHTVFVRRPGKAFNPAGTKPDIVVSDLTEFAHHVAARRGRGL